MVVCIAHLYRRWCIKEYKIPLQITVEEQRLLFHHIMCLHREYEFNSLSFMYCSNSHLCAFKLDFPENFPHKWIHLEQQRDSIGGWNVCVCVCAFGWLGSYNGAFRWKFFFRQKHHSVHISGLSIHWTQNLQMVMPHYAT